MSRLNNDVIGAQRAVSGTIVDVFTNSITLISALVIMLKLDWRLTLLAIAVLPLFLVPARFLGKKLRTIVRQQMTLNAEMNAMMDETLNVSGALLAKLFGRGPDEVARFVEQSGCDALAVSIGTSHGVYQSLPKLNIERLVELNRASPVPLVMHGGSGTPADQVQAAVRNGITKMNIYADCRIALRHGLDKAAASQRRQDPLPYEVFGPLRESIAAVAKEKIELLFAANRV